MRLRRERRARHAAPAAGLLLAAAVAAGACGEERLEGQPKGLAPLTPAQRAAATPVRVRVYEYGFEPSNVVIRAGQAVGWKAVGDEVHTIMPSSQAGRELFLRQERRGEFTHRFPRPGVYPYHCAIHPRMRGRVTVVRSVSRR